MAERSLRGDGFARLTAAGTEVLTWPDEGGLLFLDLDFGSRSWDRAFGAVRSVPPALIAECSRVLVRSPVVRWLEPVDEVDVDDQRRVLISPAGWPDGPDELADAVSNLMVEYRLPPRPVGAFESPVASDPLVSEGVTFEELANARSVELEAYLRAGRAIWEPGEYHYQLPSGVHASSFVRVADAFRDPRAPSALASWLHSSLSGATLVVIDSGTLAPMVQQLELVVARAAERLPVAFHGLVGLEALDQYPFSRFELNRRFERNEGVDVLAILSVSSTGRTYRLLRQSLAETAGSWTAECLVGRDRRADVIAPRGDNAARNPWLQIGALEQSADPAKCDLCRTTERARVVHIDPATFATMALPAPTLLMADTFAARRNASLFEAYQSIEFHEHTVQLAGTERSRARAIPYHRPDEPRRVRFEPVALLLAPDLPDLLQQRIDELRQLRRTDRSKPYIEKALSKLDQAEPTVALCDEEEIRVLSAHLAVDPEADPATDADRRMEEAERRMLEVAKAIRPSVQEVVHGESGLADLASTHSSILVLSAGLLTGVTLQHLVVEVRSAFAATTTDPEMFGAVIHAHPYDSEAWDSVRNTFGGRRDPALLALWLTYLPELSPMSEERDALLQIGADALEETAGAAELHEERLRWLSTDRPISAEVPAPPSPLWSPRPLALGRTSIFGGLDDRHTVAAVGSALHEAFDRHASRGAPVWVRIDLPNALRSFFDGLIHAAILRWTSPARAWWGRPNECEALIGELRARYGPESQDWQLLLPELLLAAAQGKVPDEGVEMLLAEADAQLGSGDWPTDVLAYVAMGKALVEQLWTPAQPA